MADRKTALVTAAGSGMGAAIARKLAGDGKPVILHGSRETDALRALASDLDSPMLTMDVTDATAVDRAAGDLKDKHGALAGMIYAVAAPFPHKLTHRTDWSVFQTQMDSQLKGLHLTMSALRLLLAGHEGTARVIVLSTEFMLGMPPVKIAPYLAAKAALTSYAQVVAQEWLKAGIRVHLLAPGMVRSALTGDMPDEYLDQVAEGMPEKRLTGAEDVADVAGFLMTDAADTLYGTLVPVSRAARR